MYGASTISAVASLVAVATACSVLSRTIRHQVLETPTKFGARTKNTSEKFQFIREWKPAETRFLQQALAKGQNFIVICGPPNSGKSSLAKATLYSMKDTIVTIDLRQQRREDIGRVDQQRNDGWSTQHSFVDKNTTLESLAQTLEIALDNSTAHDGRCILFLDHADELEQLCKQDNNKLDVTQFLYRLLSQIEFTKHTLVLTSTTAFVFNRLLRADLIDRAQLIYVCDLSEDKAWEFYNKEKDRIVRTELREHVPAFEDIWPVLGGRIHDLRMFLHRFDISEGKYNVQQMIDSAETRLQLALHPKNKQVESESWTRQDVLKLFKLISDSPRQCILCREAIELVGLQTLSSLLKHGFLMYRPAIALSDDPTENRTPDYITLLRPIDATATKQLLQHVR